MKRPIFLVAFATLTALASASTTSAKTPDPDLMRRLSDFAARFKTLQSRASYACTTRVEELDGDGKTDAVRETQYRAENDARGVSIVVTRHAENGQDKTAERRKKALEDAKDWEKDRKDLQIPLLASEQGHYVFDEVETDKADPSRVRIHFAPKSANAKTIEGSMWVDTRSATPVSAAFKMSKPGAFVSFVNVMVEFGAQTALGPAISRIRVEGKGGVLWVQKRIRSLATISDYRVSP
jgi:hypothetical protein